MIDGPYPVGDARRAWRTLHARARKAEAKNRALLARLAELEQRANGTEATRGH